MKFSVPWTVDGVRPDARMAAREAARHSGMSVGDWLNCAILERAVEDDCYKDGRDDRELRAQALDLLHRRLDELANWIDKSLQQDQADTVRREQDEAEHIGKMIDGLKRQLKECAPSQQRMPPNIVPSIVPAPTNERAGAPQAAPAVPASNQGLSEREEQLQRIGDQIETLLNPGLVTINEMRAELEELSRTINEALPRQTLDAIERQLQALFKRITDDQQLKTENSALARLEHGLAEIRGIVSNFTPSENYVEALNALTHKIDLIAVRKNTLNPKQLEDSVASLREMITHLASDVAVENLAAQVDGLSARLEQIQQIYRSHGAAGAIVHKPEQSRPGHLAALEASLNEGAASPAGESARFIAAVRRASMPMKNTGAPLTGANPGNGERPDPFFPRSRRMRSVKLLSVIAGIMTIVIGSILVTDHFLGHKFTRFFRDMVAMHDLTGLKNDSSKIGSDADNLAEPMPLPMPLPLQDAAQASMNPSTQDIASNGSPANNDLFAAPPISNQLIQTVPSLFDPPLLAKKSNTKDSNSKSGAGEPIAAGDAAAHPSLQASPPAPIRPEQLPAAIGGERLRQAAIAGDPAAAYVVARRYAEGHGVPVNLEAAVSWYKRAASQGLVPAEYCYATMLEKGQGVKKDLTQARQFYRDAANKGDAKSMHNLAVLYTQGVDGNPDYAAAVIWFRKAANHGIKDSQYNLAVLTARGLGTEKNLSEAYKWFALAAGHGDREAATRRDEIAAQLGSEQLAAGKEAVHKFAAMPQPKEAVLVPAPAGGWDQAADNSPPPAKAPALNPPLMLDAFRISAR